MLRTLITIAAVAAVLALPGSALALHAPLEGAHTSKPAATGDKPVNLLRDGKYLPTPTTGASGTVEIVRVIKPGGFDFRDAGIGAGIGAVALALLGGVVIALSREREATRTARTTAS